MGKFGSVLIGSLFLPYFLFIPPVAEALSDPDHEFFMTRPDYAEADKLLSSSWNKLKNIIPQTAYRTVLVNQKKWIMEKRDLEVAALKSVYPYMDDCSLYFISSVARALLLDIFATRIIQNNITSEALIYDAFYSLDPAHVIEWLIRNIRIEIYNPYNNIGSVYRTAKNNNKHGMGFDLSGVLMQIQGSLKELKR